MPPSTGLRHADRAVRPPFAPTAAGVPERRPAPGPAHGRATKHPACPVTRRRWTKERCAARRAQRHSVRRPRLRQRPDPRVFDRHDTPRDPPQARKRAPNSASPGRRQPARPRTTVRLQEDGLPIGRHNRMADPTPEPRQTVPTRPERPTRPRTAARRSRHEIIDVHLYLQKRDRGQPGATGAGSGFRHPGRIFPTSEIDRFRCPRMPRDDRPTHPCDGCRVGGRRRKRDPPTGAPSRALPYRGDAMPSRCCRRRPG